MAEKQLGVAPSGNADTATVGFVTDALDNYVPTSADIGDATTVGRAVLTAINQAAARTAIGAGTSSLALGTTSSTAKAGDYQPAAANISDSTSVGREVVTAASRAAVRAAANLPNIIYAADTIVADGVTDVSAALGDLIATAPANSTIQLGAGTYYVPTIKKTLTNSPTILGVPGKTKLLGSGTRVGQNTDYIFDLESGSFTVRDVEFSSCWTLLFMRNLRDVTDIAIDRCAFTSGSGVVFTRHETAVDDVPIAAGKTMSFRDFRMSHSKVVGCELGVRLNTSGGWRAIHIHDNVFEDVGHAAVYTGYSLRSSMDYASAQGRQDGVHIHDNTFRNIRQSLYALGSKSGANAILAMGQGVIIHDNYIEDVSVTDDPWHDCEGIYTKAKWTDIHDNILVNAGGTEAAIMCKGGDFDAETVLAASMNGLSLPQSTIEVESTEGFEMGTTGGYKDSLRIVTSTGTASVTYTGKTETTFTGCSGGTGTMSTGGAVTMGSSGTVSIDPLGSPTRIHHNIVVFTSSRADLKAINTDCRRVHITDNVIIGATGRAAIALDGGTIERNTVYDHHGPLVFGVFGSGTVARDNCIYNFDGSAYPDRTTFTVFNVQALSVQAMKDVLIVGNVLRNSLTSGGSLSTTQTKTRFCALSTSATGTLNDVQISRNRARNLSKGIVSTGNVGTIIDVDNSWLNEEGTAVTDTITNGTRGLRKLPAGGYTLDRTVVSVTGSTTVGSVGDYLVLINDPSGAPILPSAVSNTGNRYVFKNISTALRTISTTSSQTIEGSTTYTLGIGASIEVISDGSNWRII